MKSVHLPALRRFLSLWGGRGLGTQARQVGQEGESGEQAVQSPKPALSCHLKANVSHDSQAASQVPASHGAGEELSAGPLQIPDLLAPVLQRGTGTPGMMCVVATRTGVCGQACGSSTGGPGPSTQP